MNLSRRQLVIASAATCLSGLLGACARPGERFKPTVGQAGKDVVWVPTPDSVVERMLDMANVRAGDRVVDLGSGDGKIAIAAAKRGARSRGIEYNPDMVALSKRNAEAARVSVDFMQGDIFTVNFTDAEVITLYLLPQLNERLRPILLDMKPGTRVTSHQFNMGDWQPDRTDDLEGRQAHLWIVPAKVAGNWTLRVADQPEFQVRIEQRYQTFEGQATQAGNAVQLQTPKLDGPRISFSLPDRTGGPMRFDGTVTSSARIEGTATLPDGQRKPFTGARS